MLNRFQKYERCSPGSHCVYQDVACGQWGAIGVQSCTDVQKDAICVHEGVVDFVC